MAKSKDIIKEPKDGEVRKLKNHIHHLENEIKKLKSELKTYDRVFSKQVTFIKEKSRGLSLEDMLEGAQSKQTLDEIVEGKKNTFDNMKKHWGCHDCDGVFKLIIVPNNRYFRRCSLCEKRTEIKSYEEGEQPEGVL